MGTVGLTRHSRSYVVGSECGDRRSTPSGIGWRCVRRAQLDSIRYAHGTGRRALL